MSDVKGGFSVLFMVSFVLEIAFLNEPEIVSFAELILVLHAIKLITIVNIIKICFKFCVL